MTSAEIGMFKILVKHPNLVRVLQDKVLISDESVALFKLLQKEATVSMGVITKTVLHTLLAQSKIKIDASILNAIYTDMTSVSSNIDIAKRDLLSVINLQTRDANKATILARLDKAKRLVESNNMDKAHNIIRNIHFSTTEEIMPTKQLMIESVSKTSGFLSGVGVIDNSLGAFLKGNITSLVSDSGAMKTYFSMWLMLQMLIKNPTFVGVYFEKEMPAKDIGRRLLSWLVKVSSMEILKRSIDDHSASVKYFEKEMHKHLTEITDNLMSRFHVIPNNKFDTPMDMLRYIELYNADVSCLDYMTQLGSDDYGLSYNEKVMNNINTVKKITNETETHMIIINQTSKDTSGSNDKRITSAKDIAWSKEIENVSATILSLFSPKIHHSSFTNAPFMKATSAPPFDESYYYALPLKVRESKSREPIVIKALPEEAKFEEFNTEEHARALNWYNQYVDYVSKPSRISK